MLNLTSVLTASGVDFHTDDAGYWTSLASSTWTTLLAWWYLVPPLLVIYVFACTSLRERRKHDLESKFRNRALSTMTDDEAHHILTELNEMEFPAMYYHALQIALFRTYGIPSISKLLRATTQLTAKSLIAKRYADTTGLVTECYLNEPNSPRGRRAFARLNFLHGNYINKGLISNDDMLYTLAMFMNHPVIVIAAYEWRCLTDVERCAMGVWHCSMGRAMDIDFGVLPSSKSGWRDGLHFYDELDLWAKGYEEKVMVPDEKCHEVSVGTADFFKSSFPTFMHGAIQQALVSVIDERLRRAIMFEDPNWVAPLIIKSVVAFRKLLTRYFMLPRPEFMRSKLINEQETTDGRRVFNRFEGAPYYVRPTLMNRYGPASWGRRLMGLPLPGDKGLMSEGFLIEDFGPAYFHGKGAEEAENTVRRLEKERTGGCPFMVR